MREIQFINKYEKYLGVVWKIHSPKPRRLFNKKNDIWYCFKKINDLLFFMHKEIKKNV